MASIKASSSLRDYQDFVNEVYAPKNRRHFNVEEMLTNIERFAMRGMKGIRKGDKDKIEINVMISLSWFISLLCQLDVGLEDSVWRRFPYSCSYCGECPCVCRERKVQKRIKSRRALKARPKTIHEIQTMFNEIYPAKARTLEHAGIHWVEEIGELSEAVLRFRGHHRDEDFTEIGLEAADLFSCFMGVMNSLGVDYQKELMSMFSNGCHVCHDTPCSCEYDFVINFKS